LVMKKLLQFVVLALTALLAVEPALATMTCAQLICGPSPTSANCCRASNNMSQHEVSSNAAMRPTKASQQATPQSIPAELSCSSGSCCTVSSFTTPKFVPSTKCSFSSSASFTPPGRFSPVTAPVRAALATGDAGSSAPARYILFQAFRI